ncbi:MAG: HAD family hydrolase [Caldilineaceae bacterium]|nr:HAD family hydrolase [Caldilineaceae bacterium]
MNIDAVLFDLDGTLVQHGHVLLPGQLAAWGHPRSQAAVEEAFRIQIQWFYSYTAQLMAAGREDPHLFNRLYERVTMQMEIDDPSVPMRMARYFANDPVPPLYDDVLPLLARLEERTIPLGIITQRDRQGAVRFLREHSLYRRFPVLIAGDDGHGRKPTPDPFHAALEKLSVAPERTIFIGDRIDDDCGGAVAAGLRPFLIDRDEQHTDEASAGDFTSLRRLTDLIPHLSSERITGYG